jgi:NAD(P)-dependent dehydrogenase (short-subunit alcohol dehydrogenase family)
MRGLTGRRVLVTGASRGVGRGIANAFAAAGAHVVLTARNKDNLERTRAEIVAAGGIVDAVIPGDLLTKEGCYAVARQCGDVDVLVNNAGETSGKFMPVFQRDDEYWEREFQLNLFAPLVLMQQFGPHMERQRWGSIINISSISAQRGTPLHASYAASKAALEALSKVAAMELAKSNVNVVAIALGNTDTEALREGLAGVMTVEELGRRISPIGRAVKVSEVAALCVHVASEDSRALTGLVITIDGALTTGMHIFSGLIGHVEPSCA